MRVFLTGGSGLLGSHLAAHLRGYGHDVVALHRAESDTDFLAGVGCTLVPGEVTNTPATLTRLMRGCTHVVHAAALVYKGGSWAEVRAVNVDGTRIVLEAAAAAGIRHAVHVSSVAVYGTVSTETDETSPVDTPVAASNLYARPKREAERVAREVESEHALPVTVLRPSGVYGERDRLLAARVARMVRRPVAHSWGLAETRLRWCTRATWPRRFGWPWRRNEARRRTMWGSTTRSHRGCSWRESREGWDGLPRLVTVPGSLVRAAADLLGTLGVSAPGVEGLPPGRVARLAMGENPYPSRRIRMELGWSPPHRHEEALVRTGRWLREHAEI